MQLHTVLLLVTASVALLTMIVSRGPTTKALLRRATGTAAAFYCAAGALLGGALPFPGGIAPLAFAVAPALLLWGVYRDEWLQ